ncbi:MAG: phage minor capsid protein, partial [Hydrogenoanaerobacterium sp.]
MLNEEQLKELPEPIIKRLEALNTKYLTKIGQHINDIGQMSPTDIHRLVRMKDFGADVDEITKELERITAKNAEEIHSIYHLIAEENSKFAEKFMGSAYIPYAENAALQAYVTAAAAQTVQTYVQMSKHTAFYVFSKGGRKVPTSLGETYTRVIDQAITAITTGTSDYYTEMRGVMKDLADSGIRTKYKPLKGTAGKTADYATGYSRRLDTAIRQNILWGVKELNQGISEQLGKEFGADGWEIDYHAHPRPTHEGMGGKQYAIGKAQVINGRHYKSFSEVEGLLSEYGCLHLKFPIILGVSEPTYTDKQLDKFEAADKKTFEFEGKHYTKYKAS